MKYPIKCNMLPILALHSHPFSGDPYVMDSMTERIHKVDEFYGEQKHNPSFQMPSDVAEAHSKGVFTIDTCKGCEGRGLDFCKGNMDGYNPIYAVSVYSTVAQAERKIQTAVLMKGSKTRDDFVVSVRAMRSKNLPRTEKSAHNKMNAFGIRDARDYDRTRAYFLDRFESMFGPRDEWQEKHSLAYFTFTMLAGNLPNSNSAMRRSIHLDVSALSDVLVSNDDLGEMFRAYTGDDILVDLWEPYFSRIEFSMQSVKTFREHLRRRRC